MIDSIDSVEGELILLADVFAKEGSVAVWERGRTKFKSLYLINIKSISGRNVEP